MEHIFDGFSQFNVKIFVWQLLIWLFLLKKKVDKSSFMKENQTKPPQARQQIPRVHRSVSSSGWSSRIVSDGLPCSYKGSAILPSADHRARGGWGGKWGGWGSLLAPWHNWQTVWCHLTPRSPLSQCSPFSLLPCRAKKGGERRSFSLLVAGLGSGMGGGEEKIKLLHSERHISGSGSANVGDRGIGGLKPSLSAFA